MTVGLEPKRTQRLANKRRGALKDETGVQEMCRCQIRTAKRYYAESHEGRSHDSRQTARKIDKQCRASRTLESFQREALRKHGRRARDKPEGARSQTLREHEGNSSSRTSVKNEGGGNATAEIEGEGNATAANEGGRGGGTPPPTTLTRKPTDPARPAYRPKSVTLPTLLRQPTDPNPPAYRPKSASLPTQIRKPTDPNPQYSRLQLWIIHGCHLRSP